MTRTKDLSCIADAVRQRLQRYFDRVKMTREELKETPNYRHEVARYDLRWNRWHERRRRRERERLLQNACRVFLAAGVLRRSEKPGTRVVLNADLSFMF